MDGAERTVPGEALAKRMDARTRRRPRICFAPEFYARLGLDDPWALPESPVDSSPTDGMVYLSAAPFYAMMRRLAASRKRREKRAAEFAARRAGTTVKAAARRWPGESLVPRSRLATLTVDDMTMPAPIPVAAAPVDNVIVEDSPVRRAYESMRPVANPWNTTPYAPARVAAPPSATMNAGARLARATLARELDDVMAEIPLKNRRSAKQTAINAETADERREEIIRVVRRSGMAAPLVRTIYETAGPAEQRLDAVVGARAARGLRPLLARSPGMALASNADFDRAVAGSMATPDAVEAARPERARRETATHRATARATRGAPATTLAASPVVSSTPSFTTSSARIARPVARPSAGRVERGGISPIASGHVEAGARSLTTGASAFRGAATFHGGDATSGQVRAARAHSEQVFARAEQMVPAPNAPALRTIVRDSRGVWVGVYQGAPVVGGVLQGDSSLGDASAPVAAAMWAAARAGSGSSRRSSVLPRPIASSIDFALPRPADALGVPPPATSTARTAEGTFVPAKEAVAHGAALSSLPRAVRAALVAQAQEARGAQRSPAFRTPDTAYDRAGSWTTPDNEFRGAASTRTEFGDFLGAPTTRTPDAPWRGAPVAPARVPGIRAPDGVLVDPGSGDVAVTPADDARRGASPPLPVPMVAATARGLSPDFPALPAPSRAAPARGMAAIAASQPAPIATPSALYAAARIVRGVPSATRSALPRTTPLSPDRVFAAPERAVVSTPVASADGAERAVPSTTPRAYRSATLTAVARTNIPAGTTLAARRAPPITPSSSAITGPLSWARAALGRSAASAPEMTGLAAPESTWSASTPVRTANGVWVGARTAASTPGVRLVADRAGRPAVPVAPTRRSPTFRTADLRFAGASTATTPEGEFSGAPTAHTRSTDWVSARSGITDATAFRGALAARTPDRAFVGANAGTSPSGTFIGAATSRTANGTFVGARTAEAQRTRTARRVAPDMALPMAAGANEAAGGLAEPAAALVPGGSRRPLHETLAGVALNQQDAAAPTWAARSAGEPLVRSSGGLFGALARASSPEDVVRVIFERAEGLRATGPLPSPIMEVAEQIRQEVRREDEAASLEFIATRESTLPAPSATILRGTSVAGVASTASRSSGSIRPVRSSAKVLNAGGGDQRIMKLVKKLEGLIHLAEAEHRLADAQRQVRMAEDTPAARAEGSAPIAGTGADSSKMDLEALSREVLEAVTRELESRRERRTEDGDESIWW